MIVGDIVSEKLIALDIKDDIQKAFEVMKTNNIRHLPILEDQKLVGILTSTDLRQVITSLERGGKGEILQFIPKFSTVDKIMTKNPITVTPKTDVQEVARLLQKHKIGGLPVVEGTKLVGMVTETDILRVFIEIMGVIKYSSRIDVVLGEDSDAFQNVSQIVKENGADIISVGISPHTQKKKRVYYFRLDTDNVDHIAQAIKDKGYKVESVVAG